jgi:cytochrome P450
MPDAASDPRTLPFVSPLPLAAQVQLLSVFFGDRMAMLTQFAHHGGDLSRFRFAGRYVVLVNEAKAVGEVLLDREADYHKGPALSIYSRPLLGNGLLTSEGDFHRKQRRLSSPAFAHKRIVSYAGPMAAAAERIQTPWQTGQTIDISHEMMRLTLGIVGKTLFDVENLENDADTLSQSLTAIMRYFIRIVRSPIRAFSASIPPWEQEARKAITHLDSMIYRLIEERRRESRDAGDLLSMLILAHDPEDANNSGMENTQIRDEVMALFLAGHETTANALAWAWYLLAKNPRSYARLQAEVDTVLRGRTPTYDDLEHLPYTLQVLKEAMRLYPPAYALVRQAIRETQIAGRRVPPKAVVLFSPYLLHRRPDYFPEPDQFDPDRWTDAFEKTRPRYAYLPFGGGPRICIGAAFAQMEGHLLLATLAQRVTFSLPRSGYEVDPEPLITLRPKGVLNLVVTRRGAAEATV